MQAAIPFPSVEDPAEVKLGTAFAALFHYAPTPAARCNEMGIVTEMNTAFIRELGVDRQGLGSTSVSELLCSQEGHKIELLWRDLQAGRIEQFTIEAFLKGGQGAGKWSMWREVGGEGGYILVMAVPKPALPAEERDPLQAQRWEAIGRLTGGVFMTSTIC